MKKVKLYGHLAKEFGEEFSFLAKSPAEVIQLLNINFSTFQQAILNFKGEGYLVKVGIDILPLEDIHKPTSSYETIKIIPIVKGSGGGKGGGLLMLIAGAALIAFSGPIGAAMVGSEVGATTLGLTAGAWGSIASSIGMSLVLSGVSMLLYSPPPIPSNAQSINFDGAVNTIKQGECVPVGYGRCMVGSAVISAGISTQLFNGI
jgi:predicted phage tail protein